MIRIVALGTRANVDREELLYERKEDNRIHWDNASLLLEFRGKRLMIDCGELGGWQHLQRREPHWLLITHAHPDHAYGLKNRDVEVPTFANAKNERLMKELANFARFKTFKMRAAFRLGPFRIQSIPVKHSLIAPMTTFKIRMDRFVLFYAPDLLYMRAWKQKLADVNLWIADGSSYAKELLRRKAGEIYGHASMIRQMRWRVEAQVPAIYFTHIGKTQPSYVELREKLNRFNARLLRDNQTLEIRTHEKEEVTSGLYLVPPHARMIMAGTKTLIVKKRPFHLYLQKPLYLCSGRWVYGVIKLISMRPISIKEFFDLRDKHRITDAEAERWWKLFSRPERTKELYAYEFEILERFPPRPYNGNAGFKHLFGRWNSYEGAIN